MAATILKRLLLLSVAVLVVGCSSKPASRYAIDQDHGPDRQVDLSHVPDAVPRVEPRSRGGNRSPYQVLGRSYRVLDSSIGFRERGIASWYGNKFHGHKTSNGETYDMYGMSAAHKHLPLPTYVRVTNLHNGRQVVVRVNDRGPFHEGRVIDLSYAAAFRLGMLQQGTARVEVEAIDPRAEGVGATPAHESADRGSAGLVLQVGAFSSRPAAQSVKARVSSLVGELPVTISQGGAGSPLFRVRLGPLSTAANRAELEALLAAEGLPALPVVDLP